MTSYRFQNGGYGVSNPLPVACTKIRWNISIHSWVITTSGFDFELFIFYSHRHLILHRRTKFCLNRITSGWVMTLYRFFKISAMAPQINFRLRIYDGQNLSAYQISMRYLKFLIHGWVITTSGFDFDLFIVIGIANCTAYQISCTSVNPRRSYDDKVQYKSCSLFLLR